MEVLTAIFEALTLIDTLYFEGDSDDSQIKSKEAIKKEGKALPEIQEVDETEKEEPAVPNHIIM